MAHVKAIILAAGLGTRLRPITDNMPKCLAPLARRPLVDYWIDLLADAGVREMLINTSTFRDQMLDWIASRQGGGARRIHEAYEPELRGSAGTLAANAWFAEGADEIIVIYADNLSDVDLSAMLQSHRTHPDPMTMLLFRTAEPRSSGIVGLEDDGRIISFTEKPERPVSNLANAGVYVIDAEVIQEIATIVTVAAGTPDIAFDVLPRFIGRMRGWPGDGWPGYHRDIGTLESYEQAQKDAPALLRARGADAGGRRPAVFLDRDGTLIEHVHYLADPKNVALLPGVPEAIGRLRRAGFRIVLVSNQSGVGRRLITKAQLAAVNERMCELLAEEGAVLDAIYSCTSVPSSNDRTIIDDEDRKPGPGMLVRAAREHRLDLMRSWMVGDMISDVLAGRHAGCRGCIMVGEKHDERSEPQTDEASYDHCRNLAEAADLIIRSMQRSQQPLATITSDA